MTINCPTCRAGRGYCEEHRPDPCGLARINVRHEEDPETAPEGPAYYRENVPDRHTFRRRERVAMSPDFWRVLGHALAVGQAQGYTARRLRIHPTEYETFMEGVRPFVAHSLGDGDRLYGIDLVQDETCVEGPVVDWIEPLTQERLDELRRALGDER